MVIEAFLVQNDWAQCASRAFIGEPVGVSLGSPALGFHTKLACHFRSPVLNAVQGKAKMDRADWIAIFEHSVLEMWWRNNTCGLLRDDVLTL